MKRAYASVMAALGRRAAVDVVGLGEAGLDEVWRLGGPLRPGQKARAAERARLGGGQIATALVALARLGRSASFAGATGADPAGEQVLDGLRAEGVDVRAARRSGATRAALIVVDGTGDRTIIEQAESAADRIGIDDSDLAIRSVGGRSWPDAVRAAIADARVLHLDATDLAVSISAAHYARERGVVVSLDVDGARPGLDELLALVDLCVTSEGLPEKLTGERDPEKALKKLSAKTGALVACTLGARGAIAWDGRALAAAPGFSVEVVDTTACGDVFRAGLLCALLDGAPLPQALRFANAAAALKCRALGRLGCPTRAEVKALLTAAPI